MDKKLMIIPEKDNEPEYEVMYVNGKRIQIRKGEQVAVSPFIKDLYDETSKQAVNANRGNMKNPLALES